MMTNAIYPSLSGKKVIVTGGGSAIGAGIVEGFVRQGAHVGFVDIMEEPSLELVEKLATLGPKPIFRLQDVTDDATRAEGIGALVDALGGCDVLVNNAASDQRHTVDEITLSEWDRLMGVNLKHQFFVAQAVLPAMKAAGGGSIINLGSISWHLGLEELTVYQTAKAAIEGLTRSLARELGPQNIRVNAIIPGNVQTPKQMQWYTPEGEAEIVRAQCVKGRIQPVDIAAMALFLASDDARFCTAHNYWVDAGWR
jgi:NAD(P)-dependent dehydrogenase (short-subunit alcohol dehydrogenase family)